MLSLTRGRHTEPGNNNVIVYLGLKKVIGRVNETLTELGVPMADSG